MTKVLLADVNVPVPGLPRKAMVHSQGRLGTGMGEEVQTVVVAGPERGYAPARAPCCAMGAGPRHVPAATRLRFQFLRPTEGT